MNDEILAEVHAIKDKIAADNNYDIESIIKSSLKDSPRITTATKRIKKINRLNSKRTPRKSKSLV